MSERNWKFLINGAVDSRVKSKIKPVSIQNGIVNSEGKISLDQQVEVTPVSLSEFKLEIVDGTLNCSIDATTPGQVNITGITGELTVKKKYEEGGVVKVIKEDGTSNKFIVLNKVL